jgi:hypothetical protein
MTEVVVTYRGWSSGGWGTTSWGGDVQMPFATAAVGTVSVVANANVHPSGLQATGGVGTVIVAAEANVFPTGVEAIGAMSAL